MIDIAMIFIGLLAMFGLVVVVMGLVQFIRESRRP